MCTHTHKQHSSSKLCTWPRVWFHLPEKMKRFRRIIFAMFTPFKSGMRTPCSRCTASLKSPFSIPYSRRFWPLSACIMNSGLLMAYPCVNTFILHRQKLWGRGWHFYLVFQNQLLKWQILLCDDLLNNNLLYVIQWIIS